MESGSLLWRCESESWTRKIIQASFITCNDSRAYSSLCCNTGRLTETQVLNLLAKQTGTPRIATDRYGFIREQQPPAESKLEGSIVPGTAAADSASPRAASRGAGGDSVSNSGRLPPRPPTIDLGRRIARTIDLRKDGSDDRKKAVRRLRKWRKMLGATNNTCVLCRWRLSILRTSI